MAFVDYVELDLSAGKGGDGVVRWRREKYIEKGGPAGGDGGRGGSVYIQGIKDNMYLQKYRGVDFIKAHDGQDGGSKALYGENGSDVTVKVPIGTLATNLETGDTWDVVDDQLIKLLSGGQGGLGNIHFKSSTNQTPQEQTDGKLGQAAKFSFELRLIADVGLVGLPNAGKSTLINFLTNSKSKIASYQFTTLEPHLGTLDNLIIADIPGLIEGASSGKGLGHKFLQHIERTRLILHCVSLESETIDNNYKVIQKELENYSDNLSQKPQIIVFTKTDTVHDKVVDKYLNKYSDAIAVSVLDDDSIKKLIERIKNYFN